MCSKLEDCMVIVYVGMVGCNDYCLDNNVHLGFQGLIDHCALVVEDTCMNH